MTLMLHPGCSCFFRGSIDCYSVYVERLPCIIKVRRNEENICRKSPFLDHNGSILFFIGHSFYLHFRDVFGVAPGELGHFFRNGSEFFEGDGSISQLVFSWWIYFHIGFLEVDEFNWFQFSTASPTGQDRERDEISWGALQLLLPAPMLAQFMPHPFVCLLFAVELLGEVDVGFDIPCQHIHESIIPLFDSFLQVADVVVLGVVLLWALLLLPLLNEAHHSDCKDGVEDVAKVVGPMEEELEEAFTEDEEAKLEGELLGEGVEVIVDEDQRSGDGEVQLTLQHQLQSLQEVFVVECGRDYSAFKSDL